MNKIEWNVVTWYSKLLAVVFFIGIVPVLTFYIGARYDDAMNTYKNIPPVDMAQYSAASEPATPESNENPCQDQSNVGMAACAEQSFQDNDEKLNEMYAKIIAFFDTNINKKDSSAVAYGTLKSFILKSQKSWPVYRDGICTAESGIDVLDANKIPIGGTIAQITYPECQSELTQNEIKVLNDVYTSWAGN